MRSKSRRSPNKHGFKAGARTEVDVHLQGAGGELAVSLVTGILWQGSVDTFKKGGDVGPLQVRTRTRAEWDLIIRSDDRDEDVFVLVTGSRSEFVVVGWIRAADGKRPEWVRDYGDREAAWFVPQSALRPFPVPASLLSGWAKTDEDPESYTVMGHPPRSVSTKQAPPQPKEAGRCYFEARLDSPYFSPHVLVSRPDGTIRCDTCHPLTLRV